MGRGLTAPAFFMSKLFDYDPLTGLTEHFAYDEDRQKALIRTTEDVEPLLERNKALRSHQACDGKRDDWMRLYCSIPMTVVMELKKKGIDVFNRHHTKRVYQEIETNYPYLKVTDKKIAKKAPMVFGGR